MALRWGGWVGWGGVGVGWGGGVGKEGDVRRAYLSKRAIMNEDKTGQDRRVVS